MSLKIKQMSLKIKNKLKNVVHLHIFINILDNIQ